MAPQKVSQSILYSKSTVAEPKRDRKVVPMASAKEITKHDLEELILAFLAEPLSPDFIVSNHGSILILTPQTPSAHLWVSEYLPEDAMRWAGGVVIERNYITEILYGIHEDGLSIGGDA